MVRSVWHQYELECLADDFTITTAGLALTRSPLRLSDQRSADPSPITGLYYQIWDGPDDPGSSVVFGDLTTTHDQSTWSGIIASRHSC